MDRKKIIIQKNTLRLPKSAVLEVVACRGRADGRRRRPRGARAAATVVGAPCRQSAALMRAPAGCCVCGVCGAHAGALDRAIGNGEEEIREDNKNWEGETQRRLQPALLLAGGWRRVAGDGQRRRSGGRAWSGSGSACDPACVRRIFSRVNWMVTITTS